MTQQPTDVSPLVDESKRNSNMNGNDEQPKSSLNVNPLISFASSCVMIGIAVGISIATETWYCAAIAYGINWLVFIVYAWPFRSEKFYDFTGMISFLSVDIFAFCYFQGTFDSVRSIITFIMPLLWTLRLGTFLYRRILGESGRDMRFDGVRDDLCLFFLLWTLQGAWVYLCMLPVLVVQYRADDDNNDDLTAFDFIGWLLWLFGFIFEVVADRQKSAFKSDESNRGKFTNVGLWKISRHPNYFGEITLWFGLSIVACSVSKNWDWVMWLSPIYTMILLIGVSGIPASERAAKKKYGHLEEYQEYLAKTPILIPFCTCWK